MARERRRRGTALTLRGRVVLALGLVGLVVAYTSRIDAILFVAVMLVAVVAAAVLAARHRRPALAVHRSFGSERVMPGHPLSVDLTIANRSLRAVGAATWTDGWRWVSPAGMLARGATGSSESSELPPLRGRWGDVQTAVSVSWEFEPPLRGDIEVGPVRVTVGDPFGLATATVQAGDTTRLLVLPEVQALDDATFGLRRADGQAHRADHRATGGEHELTTRAYRVGDPLRRVHWRASAHHGELMVRQEEQRSAAEVSVLLETRRDRHPDAEPGDPLESDSFEWAVSMAASLAVHLDAIGYRVHLIETGAPQLAAHAGADLDGLARVALTSLERTTGVSLVPPGRLGSSRLGSIFAVLAELDDATVGDLVAGRAPYDSAVAFVPAWSSDEDLARLAAAGWTCIPVGVVDEPRDAWASSLKRGAA
ncbi:DUF58 domain-containing protein [Salinibacterium sp. SYSU T00001]|uniref:DUF58 domain-containing protein n=1 Tax=Homoserinimonas sedimenticola TaxID=2986805 RepID=UPI00223628E4|nr:DUF58 domain-containing protein [Salinibacterium sedimenticola]MCW4384888.1 DUF58 domain-containing protein [Salinibacterium sedimenticola]